MSTTVRVAPPRCSGCGATNHNLRTCAKRLVILDQRRREALAAVGGAKR